MSRRPADTDFKQQRLPAWQPILTPKWVITTFFIVGIVFLPLGVILKQSSDQVVEHEVLYDATHEKSHTDCHVTKNLRQRNCTISITVKDKMKSPVYVYYQLDNFYQNHRRYVKSRSESQLRGQKMTKDQLSDCEPLITKNVSGTVKTLNPCGLVANSYFDDIIKLTNPGFTLDERDIAWGSDKDKFVQPTYNQPADEVRIGEIYPSLAAKGVEDPHFMVWMRTAGLPNFRKLYAKIATDIPADTTLNFELETNFEVQSFHGSKSLVISTTSWLGGKNPFLGYAYMTVGGLCLVLALIFKLVPTRNLGDPSYLNWKNN